MYAEHNDSIDPNRDWELSVEFEPTEQAEYEFYVSPQREIEIRAEVPREEVRETSSEAKGSREYLHVRMLQPTRHKARSRQRHCW